MQPNHDEGKQIALRVSAKLYEQIKREAQAERRKPSQLMRNLIEDALAQRQPERAA